MKEWGSFFIFSFPHFFIFHFFIFSFLHFLKYDL